MRDNILQCSCPVSKGIDLFLDGPSASALDAVRIVFADEKVRQEYVRAAPDVDECDASGRFRVVDLEALVRMKLTSFRQKDQVHLLDLIELEMIDDTWPARFGCDLGDRLQQLLDNPDG